MSQLVGGRSNEASVSRLVGKDKVPTGRLLLFWPVEPALLLY